MGELHKRIGLKKTQLRHLDSARLVFNDEVIHVEDLTEIVGEMRKEYPYAPISKQTIDVLYKLLKERHEWFVKWLADDEQIAKKVNPIFEVYYHDKGRKLYSLIQAKDENEAKMSFHRTHKDKEIVEVRKVEHL